MIKAQTNLSEEIRVEQTHDRSGQPDKHEIALQAAPEVHREIMTLNTDNESTRERIEEDTDFNIPGLPHSTVKQLHGANIRELIQKIENHPNRHALQRDLQQSQSFNPFSQESKQMIHEVGNIELCELLDMGTQNTVQNMFCRTGTSALSTARAGTSCEMERRRTRNSSSTLSISSQFPITTSRKGDPTGTVTGRKPGDGKNPGGILHTEHHRDDG